MKDIYVPRKVSRIEVREKLHGHTKIELRNVRTGKVERIEHDNAFTDGVESYMRNLGMFQNSPYQGTGGRSNPLWQQILGGIFLFDTALPTSPQAKYMPAGTSMTANGVYGISNSGAPTELGSYNSIESVMSGNSLSFVYDWGTSQGNGEIASVALTTKNGAYIGYGNKSGGALSSQRSLAHEQSLYTYGTSTSNGAHERYLIYDNKFFAPSVGYTGSIPEGATSVTLKYRHLAIDEADIFATEGDFNPANFPSEMVFNLTTPIPAGGGFGGYNGVPAGPNLPSVFMLVPSGAPANGSSARVYFLDVSDGTSTEYVVTNNTGEALQGYIGWSFFPIDDTYAVVINSARTKIYKINYRTSAVVDSCSGLTAISPYRSIYGGFLTEDLMALDETHIYDTVLNRLLTVNGGYRLYQSMYLPDIDALDYTETVSGTTSWNHAVCKNPLRLMTINNLDSPVTKTADKTMKVTYTVTRASA